MASLVKNIEKEFLLTTAMRERAAINMSVGGGEWKVRIVEIRPNVLYLAHEAPLSLLRRGLVCDFHYNVRGQTIAFKAAISEPGEKRLGISPPDKVFKNLSRKFARLPPPGDLSAAFSFAGERYDLAFPASEAYCPPGQPEPSPDFNPADIRGLVAEFERKALELGSERGIVMYKDRKPEGPIECLAASTGKAFYLPTAIAGIPRNDPFAERSILTRDDFVAWFEDTGIERGFSEDETVRLEHELRNKGVISELLVPILFQDYAIGFVTIVNRQAGKPPFDLRAVETFTAFTRAFAWSLNLHNYFKDAPKLDQDYKLQVVDVSAGGLLFACKDARLKQALKEDLEVTVRLRADKRSIDATGAIRRRFAGPGDAFFGIEFSMMAPEDFRFLFEYLYGRPFTDDDADCVEGVRINNP